MGLSELVNRLASQPFYLVQPLNSKKENIKSLNINDIISYFLRTKSLPTAPKVTFIGGGGSAKGYWTLGFVSELLEYIKIDQYIVTSVSALLAVGQEKGTKELEEFALRVPELLVEERATLKILAQASNYIPFGIVDKLFARLILPLKLSQAEIDELSSGTLVMNPKGIFNVTKLEKELRNIFWEKKIGEMDNFIIMAIDYNTRRPVALGKEYPEMPVYTAILAGIALQMIIPYQRYSNSLFGDAGPVYNFPLLKELIDKDTKTIIAVDLNYNNVNSLGDDSLPFFLVDKAQHGYIADKEMTRRLLREVVNAPPEEILRYGDRKNYKLSFNAPKIQDILTNSIYIPLPRRETLIAEGHMAAKELIERFRKPLWSIQYLNR